MDDYDETDTPAGHSGTDMEPDEVDLEGGGDREVDEPGTSPGIRRVDGESVHADWWWVTRPDGIIVLVWADEKGSKEDARAHRLAQKIEAIPALGLLTTRVLPE